jgi:hypothetical protein
LTDVEEAALGTDPLDADTDDDGIGDASDAFPLDPRSSSDLDADGVADDGGDTGLGGLFVRTSDGTGADAGIRSYDPDLAFGDFDRLWVTPDYVASTGFEDDGLGYLRFDVGTINTGVRFAELSSVTFGSMSARSIPGSGLRN